MSSTEHNETAPEPTAEDDTRGDSSADEVVMDVAAIQTELESLRNQNQQLFEKLARAQADFQNSRRRLESDAEQRLAYANESLIRNLLPVLDNFDRALQQDAAKTSAVDLHHGISLVSTQLRETLSKYEVEEVAPSAGAEFDPARHQAIMRQPSDLPEGSVTMLLQKGYVMKGRVLRAAQVAVAVPAASD
jgi:molecular chaperone GrpE